MAKKVGRPRKPLNWDEIDKLLHMQCTDAEVAGWFDSDVKLLKRACAREMGIDFAQYAEQKRANGKISLRRAMWQKALDPKNTTATIFACKKYLGMDDYPASTQVSVETKKDENKIKFVTNWGSGFESSSTGKNDDE